jgi:hypothetical protein
MATLEGTKNILKCQRKQKKLNNFPILNLNRHKYAFSLIAYHLVI